MGVKSCLLRRPIQVMTEIISLSLVMIFQSFCCYLAFNKDLYDKWYFIPGGLLCSSAGSMVWLMTARIMNDPRRLYIFSFAWDLAICSVYFLLPVFVAKIRLNKYELIGICVMATGLMIMKIKGE